MLSPEELNILTKKIMEQLKNYDADSDPSEVEYGNLQENMGTEKNNSTMTMTPSQALIIGGVLGGVFEVESVLVDKDQSVQIVLSGSLKEKSELEKMLDQIGGMPFNEVMKALVDRLV
ncbi:MAG: hypothetical protein N2484_01360 [Clostridia bacterium]|nr:hypothetical protein [Clostridia bacterium]